MDTQAADRLKALQILNDLFRGSPSQPTESVTINDNTCATPIRRAQDAIVALQLQGKSQHTELDCGVRENASDGINDNEVPVHELNIAIEGLQKPIRLLEAVSSEEATQLCHSLGEEDPFGAKAWPAAYLVARRLLQMNIRGCTVLELGCGTGLVSVAAAIAGARFVLATDRSVTSVRRAVASAALNGHQIYGEVFDVMLPQPLPSRGFPRCGNQRTQTYKPCCAEELPDFFDVVVFSDVLYWNREAVAFGRRAAEAYAAGSTVVVADPGRRRDDFLEALTQELTHLGVEPLPVLQPMPANVPEAVNAWISAEVRTASSLFCAAPFELVLQPPRQQPPGDSVGAEVVRDLGSGPSIFQLPRLPLEFFELVD